MGKLLKSIAIALAMVLLFSACGTTAWEKSLAEIEKYFDADDYNACQKYISELDSEIIKEINSSSLHLITEEFLELLSENNFTLEATYSLDSISNEFTENCRKLWNVAKLFDIKTDYNDYNNLALLHYYGEMSNYTKYSEIFKLLKAVHQSEYLDKITSALLSYEENGDSSSFKAAYETANAFSFSDFNPQEYLVEDYKTSHEGSVKALKSIYNGIATNNVTVILSGINDLEESLTEILNIIDIANAVHFQQQTIYNDILEKDIYKSFNHYIDATKREYSVYSGFALNNIFGELQADSNEPDNENTENVQATLSVEDTLKIVVNAINKTKKYKSSVDVAYSQTRNISLIAFSTDFNEDLAELSKAQFMQALDATNGTGTMDYTFNNGVSGDLTLSTFVPPANNEAYVNAEAVKDYKLVKGSGGYIISLTLYPEASSSEIPADGVNSLINGFALEGSDSIIDAKTSYSAITVNVTVRNNGLLEKMSYSIKGISDCDCGSNGVKQFEADFSFEESYVYEFKY